LLLAGWLIVWLTPRPWRWRRYTSSKLSYTYITLYCDISRRVVFFGTLVRSINAHTTNLIGNVIKKNAIYCVMWNVHSKMWNISLATAWFSVLWGGEGECCHQVPFDRLNFLTKDGAVAQAVSRWLLTSAARFRIREACGVCGGQNGTRASFLRVLLFPLPIYIPPISLSSWSLGAGIIGLLVIAVPSGLNWTQPPPNYTNF
jgi:hypothetical protein